MGLVRLGPSIACLYPPVWLQTDPKARVSIDAPLRIALCLFMLLRLHCTAVPMVGPSGRCLKRAKEGESIMAETDSAARAKPGNFARNHSAPRIIDLSIDLDAKTFHMRSYDGFKKNMEFDVEVIKDYPGGLGQIVRGVHMRLHAGSHIDAPSHMLQGGLDMHEVPLAAFIGDAVVADVRPLRRNGGDHGRRSGKGGGRRAAARRSDSAAHRRERDL